MNDTHTPTNSETVASSDVAITKQRKRRHRHLFPSLTSELTKQHLEIYTAKFTTDTMAARCLGITPQTLSNYRSNRPGNRPGATVRERLRMAGYDFQTKEIHITVPLGKTPVKYLSEIGIDFHATGVHLIHSDGTLCNVLGENEPATLASQMFPNSDISKIECLLADFYEINTAAPNYRNLVRYESLVREFVRLCPEHPIARRYAQQIESVQLTKNSTSLITE